MEEGDMTIIDFLRTLVEKEGAGCLQDGGRINGYLADYFPGYVRERTAIRVANSLGYGGRIWRLAMEPDANVQKIKIQQIKQQLSEETWLNPEAIEYVLRVYTSVASIDYDNTHNAYSGSNVDVEALFKKIDSLSSRNQFLENEVTKLKAQIKESIQAQKEAEAENKYVDALLEAVAKKAEAIYRHYNNSENKEFDIIDIDSFLSSPKARDKEYLWKVGTRLFNDSNSEKREKGLKIIENLSDREFVDAQLILADFYEKCHEEVKAFVWYERAAKNGNVEAAFKMYMMCGAAGDYVNAAKWCEQAAQRGNVDAQFHYGVLLQQGIGLSANKQLALQWYKRSAMAGHIEAKKRHDELLAIINL